MEYFEITEHPNIEDARKDLQPDGSLYLGEDGTYSEWALVMAMRTFDIGAEVSEDEFCKAIMEATVQQHLDALCKEGLIKAVWDEDSGDLAYYPS